MRRAVGGGGRAGPLAAAALLLASCSYGYDLRAVAIGGRLAFVSAKGDYRCVSNVQVLAESGPRAQPARGDDPLLVLNGGAFWYTDNPVEACSLRFPVFYGSSGAQVKTAVAAKPLRVGVAYAVDTVGEGAYGSGCFRITAARRVENLTVAACRAGASGG